MNITTEPIRDKKLIKDIFTYLKGNNPRNYLMAKVQLNTALRISDVLQLKVKDFMHPNLRLKRYLAIYEIKTGKEKKIIINKELAQCIKEYIIIQDLSIDDYLFPSNKNKLKPISTTQAHRIYQDIGKLFHIEKFNSHSLRKTWGFYAYKETKNLALIMSVYNHTDMKETLKYIGITQGDINDLYEKISF